MLQEKKYFEEPFKCTFSFAYKLDVYIPITNRQIILEKFLEEWTSTKTKIYWDASRVCEDVCEEKVNLGGSELSFL